MSHLSFSDQEVKHLIIVADGQAKRFRSLDNEDAAVKHERLSKLYRELLDRRNESQATTSYSREAYEAGKGEVIETFQNLKEYLGVKRVTIEFGQ
jgi:hypothetical protein